MVHRIAITFVISWIFFLQKQALEKAQAAHFGDPITKINLDGIEAVTDELFYALTQELKGLTSLSCVGCIHITDYGVKLLAEEFNGLDEVCLQVFSLRYCQT